MRQLYHLGDRRAEIDVRSAGETLRVELDGRVLEVEVLAAEAQRLDLRVEGRRWGAWVAPDGDLLHVGIAGRAFTIRRQGEDDDEVAAPDEAGPHVRSPMPGKVVKLLAAPGERVAKGAGLLILEAMKMETEIAAPVAGVVAAIHVAAGQIVGLEAPLVDIEPEGEAGDAQGSQAAR